ncbi:MAG: alpha/beta hydrolase [Sandaracinaceae bacterium]|nr:alpha/beta hydrolase [Sandaracinaceae bacterium]
MSSAPCRTLVLLPPLGHDSALYAPLAGALGDRAEVQALDYPGFGARALGTFDYTAPALFERLLDDVRAQLTERGVARAPYALGGVSLGATLSIALAGQLAHPPAQLLLMASGGRRVARIRRETVRTAIYERGAAAFAREHLGLDHGDLERSSLRQHIGLDGPGVRTYFAHYFDQIWNPRDFDARAVAATQMLDAALDVDLEDALRANRIPAALLWGDADRIFNAKHTERLRELIAHSVLHVLPGVGHYPPLECPAHVADIFLRTTCGAPLATPESLDS